MKRKIHKILGVTLTLVMVLTLAVAFSAPAMAAEEEWDLFEPPDTGADGDWFMDTGIVGLGPLAKAIDDTLYTVAYAGAADFGEGTFNVTDGTYTTTRITDELGAISASLTGSWAGDVYGSFFATGDASFTVGGTLATEGTIKITGTLSAEDAQDAVTFLGTVVKTGGPDPITTDSLTNITGSIGIGATTGAFDADLNVPGVVITVVGSMGAPMLMKSTDDGRSWEETDYAADTSGGPIVDIACSSIDADIVYVTDGVVVYKTDDAGDAFAAVAETSLPDFDSSETITCLDVGYDADDNPYVFFGSADFAAVEFGGVWYIAEKAYGATWKDLEVGAVAWGGETGYDVYGIGCSPDFASDSLTVAVVTNEIETFVCSNDGTIGSWDEVELETEAAGTLAITEATNPVFAEDFDIDDANEYFIGVAGPLHTTSGLGGVYRMAEDSPMLLDDVDDDIVSLDLVGDVGSTSLLAGGASVWYSTDDGDSWDETSKAPTGVGAMVNFVIVEDDFADSGEAWCASDATTEGGVHLTTDFGDTWNGISLLDTNMAGAVYDIAFTADYGTGDAPMFMVTESDVADIDHSVWKYDGDNWERVWFDDTNELKLVEVSPDYANDTAVFIADSDAPEVLYSHDGGADFTAMVRDPGAPDGDAITSWLVIDDETVITGAAAGVTYMTTRYGRRNWDEPTMPSAASTITDLAMSPNYASDGTILAGDDKSQVFISFDEGDEFEEVSGSDIADLVGTSSETFVAFDPGYADNNIIYAASDDIVGRCVIDTGEDMGDQEIEDMGATPADAGDIVVSTDGKEGGVPFGTLYVTDRKAATPDGENGGTLPGGIHRCLNPTDALADIVFEQVQAGLSIGETAFTGNLRLSYESNILYLIDTAGVPTDVYTYEDTLAAQVILTSPAVSAGLDDENRVAFSWEDLNADTVNVYQIWVNEEEDFPAATDEEVVGPVDNRTDLHDDNELTWRRAEAGTEYFWKVRVAEGGPVLSRWSNARSFVTKVGAVGTPVGVTPGSGADDVILQPAFSWGAVTGASSYEIEVADNPGFDPLVAEATTFINAWQIDVELDYSTTYYWKVRGISASGAPAGDEVIAVFTTMAKPVAAPAPVDVTTVPAPEVTVTVPVTEITPAWIWAIIAIGAVLCIAVIILIVRTRRVV